MLYILITLTDIYIYIYCTVLQKRQNFIAFTYTLKEAILLKLTFINMSGLLNIIPMLWIPDRNSKLGLIALKCWTFAKRYNTSMHKGTTLQCSQDPIQLPVLPPQCTRVQHFDAVWTELNTSMHKCCSFGKGYNRSIRSEPRSKVTHHFLRGKRKL